MIEANVIHAAYVNKVKSIVSGSCIYPKMAEQPIKEEYLLTGALEPLMKHAIAKIAGLRCVSFIAVNIIVILFQLCQPIYMVLTIILT